MNREIQIEARRIKFPMSKRPDWTIPGRLVAVNEGRIDVEFINESVYRDGKSVPRVERFKLSKHNPDWYVFSNCRIPVEAVE